MTDQKIFEQLRAELADAKGIATTDAIDVAHTIVTLWEQGVLSIDSDDENVQRDFEQMLVDHAANRTRWTAASEAVLNAIHA